MSKSTPAKSEAVNAPVEFEFDGETYTVPPSKEWDLDALEAFESGRVLTFIASILGKDQYATFRKVPRKVADAEALFDAIQEALGIAGN